MGLSSKEVSIDDGLDWAMNLLKSDKRPRQQQQQQQQQQHRPPQLNCPRCNSTNTKFCYYNNYNRLQPRHFCKSCKRHWTKGGTLRNVPIGGRRNNKRLKTTNTNKNNSNNNTTGVIGDINFVPQRQSMPLVFEDQKNISEILYQALYQSPSLQPNYINSTFSGSSLCLPSLPNLPFTSSCFSNENPSLLSSSFIGRCESSNVCDYSGDSETVEPITTTISTMDAVTTNPLWKLSNASSLMESDCNWNWDDLNTLISNDLKQPWDDFQTKVQGI